MKKKMKKKFAGARSIRFAFPRYRDAAQRIEMIQENQRGRLTLWLR
jgi:hypothetical protein